MRYSNFLLLILMSLVVTIPGSFAAAQEVYELQFEGRWHSGLPRPGTAHFTQIIGSTHQTAGSFFSIGQQASTGVENVAELGSVGALVNEINADIASGSADSLILGTDTFIDPEEIDTFNFTVNASHSRLSFMTMIAPTPDWFVGVHDLDLRAGGNWVNQIVLDLENYDAGTENGSGFSLNNTATNPRGVITSLDSAEPSGVLFGSGPISRVTLTRISVPEPSSMIVFAGLGLALVSRRRR